MARPLRFVPPASMVEVTVRTVHGRRGVLGKRTILAQDPHDKPLASDRSSAPLVHATTRAVRIMLRANYYEFVAAFRTATARLRHGDLRIRFPPGAFPPPMPCAAPTG